MHVMIAKRFIAGLAGLLLLAGTGFAEDPANCLACHSLPYLAVLEEDGDFRNFAIDQHAFINSVHGSLSCTDCHKDVTKVPHGPGLKPVSCDNLCHVKDPYTGERYSHRDQYDYLARSIHVFRPESDHNEKKPDCITCHTNTTYLKEMQTVFAERLHKCEKCHKVGEVNKYLIHVELHLRENELWKKKENFLMCVRCHTQQELTTDEIRDKLQNENMVNSFLTSFHGRGFTYGDVKTPVCNNCHGYHNIYPHNDPRSTIHKYNIAETCGSEGCHEKASAAFTQGSVHTLYAGWQSNVLIWVKNIYIILIFSVIGGMVIHNFLDFFATKRYLRRHGNLPPVAHRYLRMNRIERADHILMFISFAMLAFTGILIWIPPDFITWLPDSVQQAQWDWRFVLHRFFAVVLLLVSLHHLIYAAVTKRGRYLFREMLPRPLDLKHIFQNLKWLLGRRTEKPRFTHFNYTEKAEYWAFVWGMIVMTATGVILWFEEMGPIFWVDLSRLIHSMEAILAVVAIVVWHFYNVHWKPGKWPMSDAWITGHISHHEMEEEHAGELENYKSPGEEKS